MITHKKQICSWAVMDWMEDGNYLMNDVQCHKMTVTEHRS